MKPFKHKKNRSAINRVFDSLSGKITQAAGSPFAFLGAVVVVLTWAITGPIFNYSDTWQLVINTGTTIITFIMVFVIQQTQNKDTMALQLKLNELIAADNRASNRLIDIEDLSEEELKELKQFYIKLSKLAKKESSLLKSHSIDEAEDLHEEKKKSQRKTSRAKPGTSAS